MFSIKKSTKPEAIIRRETGFNFIIIILIIIILTFSIKCHKNILSDNEQKKWRHCDDVKCSETNNNGKVSKEELRKARLTFRIFSDTNNNGKVSKEELTKLMSKLLTGAPWICPFSYSYFKYIFSRKSYG